MLGTYCLAKMGIYREHSHRYTIGSYLMQCSKEMQGLDARICFNLVLFFSSSDIL